MELNENLLQKIKYLLRNSKILIIYNSNSSRQKMAVYLLRSTYYTTTDLADPAIRQRAIWQPVEFIQGFTKPFMLLNIQYAPQLIEHLCSDVRRQPCIAVASQCYYIKEACKNLTGVEFIELPLNVTEDKQPFLPVESNMKAFIDADKDNGAVFERIVNGDLAGEKFENISKRDSFYTGYIQRLLQYDIKSLTPVSDEMKFYRFMCAAAACVGTVVNYAALANGADVSSPTAKQWLAYLEGAGVITLLYPVEAAGIKRLAKAPKLYFADTGLACYLLRLATANDVEASTFAGNLFENWAYMQIKNSYLQNGLKPDFGYYRDSNAKEVSILIKHNGCLYPVELRKEPLSVKKLQKKLKLLEVFEKQGELRIGSGCMVSLVRSSQQLDAGLWLVAASQL